MYYILFVMKSALNTTIHWVFVHLSLISASFIHFSPAIFANVKKIYYLCMLNVCKRVVRAHVQLK